MIETISSDVLVVGAGFAGFTAAADFSAASAASPAT